MENQVSSSALPNGQPPSPESPSPQKTRSNFLVWIAIAVVTLTIGIGIGLALGKYSTPASPTSSQISSYEDCVNAKGSIVQESYPATCVTADEKRFIQPLTDKEKKSLQPPDQNPDYKQSCMERGGLWLTEYLECESESSPNLSSEWCTNLGGEFSECQSPCRHDPKFQSGQISCATVCVKVCQFK